MKNKIIILGLFVAVALAVWFFRPKYQSHENPSTVAQEVKSQSMVTKTNPNTPTYTPPKITHPLEGSNYVIWLEKEQKEAGERALNQWKTPIEFYGRVLDESNNVVSGAKVDYSCNDTSPSGTSYYHMQSDANGGFSFKGIQGKLLEVDVSKEGYYSYDPHGQFFNYAGENQNFVPDAGNPVVFRLRKKGEGANLIHLHTNFRVPKNGTPIRVDLTTGNLTTSSQNAFQVECWTHDTEKKDGWMFDWKCRVFVPGGGLQIYDEQFPFLAPESDYTNEDIIDEPLTLGNQWSQDVRRNYYIHTADGNYGRMSFRMIAHGDHFSQIDSYLNLSGSRNLEPQ